MSNVEESRAVAEAEAAAAVAKVLGASSPKVVLSLEQARPLTQEDVRKAFRVAALQVHPDKNSCSESSKAFRKVCDAYHQMLKDIAKSGKTSAERCHVTEDKSRPQSSWPMERPHRRKRWWEHGTVAEVEAALKQEEARFYAEWEEDWQRQEARRKRRQVTPRFVPPPVDLLREREEEEDGSNDSSDKEAQRFEGRVASWRCFKGFPSSSSSAWLPSSLPAKHAAEQLWDNEEEEKEEEEEEKEAEAEEAEVREQREQREQRYSRASSEPMSDNRQVPPLAPPAPEMPRTPSDTSSLEGEEDEESGRMLNVNSEQPRSPER